ncbi:MAG TPA: hypothetical protein VFN78_01980 [Ktedonobacterales bacterium]|nr:hypothetical protein [Ktedonobacterales bacterium]
MSMDPNQPYGQQPPAYGQQPPYAATAGRWGVSALGNLGAEVISGIAYLVSLLWVVGLVAQIIIFAMEKNRYAKFHAAQAMILSIASVVLGILDIIVNGALGFGLNSSSSAANLGAGGLALVFGCVFAILGLVLFAFWIWGMIAAFTGKPTKLPIIGNIAEGLAGGPVSAI